jgi:hypothetical protein
LKVALTVTSLVTVIVQEVGVDFVQFADQLINVDPGAGVSVRVTADPTAKLWLQTAPPLPQASSGAVPLVVVTEPVPAPARKTVRIGGTTTGAVVVEDTTVSRIVDVITDPLVVTPIAVMSDP